MFDTCYGNGDATGTGCLFACGFYGNTCSVFTACTTSDAICLGCGDPCPYECDDLSNDVEWTEHEIEGVLKLEAEHNFIERETLEGVLKLEAEHALVNRDTLEGVLTLTISHTFV